MPENTQNTSPKTTPIWRLTAAQITALAAIVTSIIALCVSIYETRIMRSWQQASTQPIVEIEFEAELLASPITTDIFLTNMGQGTAYIEGLKVTYDGDIIEARSLPQYWPGKRAEGVKQGATQAYRGYLGPDAKKHPVSIRWTPPPSSSEGLGLEAAKRLTESIEKTEISVCYCSVFERCWITDFKSQSRAKLVSNCPADYT